MTAMLSAALQLPDNPDIKRILVIKWGALGDLIITTAMFNDIRRAFPNALIDLQTSPQFANLFEHDSHFDKIHGLELRKKNGFWTWMHFIARYKYDLVFDFQSNDRSRFYMISWLLSGRAPRWRVGNHQRFPYNVARASKNKFLHAFDLQQDTLRAAGVNAMTNRPRLCPGEQNRINTGQLMDKNRLQQGRYAVFFPGSQAGGLLKRWGNESYAMLAQHLVQEGLEKVVLLGGPDDIQECDAIADRFADDRLVNLCCQTEILDIVPLCEDAKLIVANDTGPAHVASTTLTPMVVICGPTDPRRVKPVGEQIVAIQADIDCASCYKKSCDHHSCMRMVTVDMVVDKLRSINAL